MLENVIGDRQTRRIIDAVKRELVNVGDDISSAVCAPSRTIAVSDTTVKPGERLRCNPQGGAFNVTLPSVSQDSIGVTVSISNITSSDNAITVRPPSSSYTINGASLLVLNVPRATTWLQYSGSGLWTIISHCDTQMPSTSGDPIWNYVDDTLPNGVSSSPILRYNFDGSANALKDLTDNGHNLTRSGGAEFYIPMPIRGGSKFLGLSESEYYYTASHADLRLLGAGTWEIVCFLNDISAASDTLFAHNAAGADIEANNFLYALRILADNGHFFYRHEYGAGVNQESTFTDSMAVVGGPMHLVLTRDSAGTDVNLYMNSVLVSNYSASNAPTGGANGALVIGADVGGPSEYFHGGASSFRMFDIEFTANQVAESYKKVRGLI